jgi:hypothetical protein
VIGKALAQHFGDIGNFGTDHSEPMLARACCKAERISSETRWSSRCSGHGFSRALARGIGAKTVAGAGENGVEPEPVSFDHEVGRVLDNEGVISLAAEQPCSYSRR